MELTKVVRDIADIVPEPAGPVDPAMVEFGIGKGGDDGVSGNDDEEKEGPPVPRGMVPLGVDAATVELGSGNGADKGVDEKPVGPVGKLAETVAGEVPVRLGPASVVFEIGNGAEADPVPEERAPEDTEGDAAVPGAYELGKVVKFEGSGGMVNGSGLAVTVPAGEEGVPVLLGSHVPLVPPDMGAKVVLFPRGKGGDVSELAGTVTEVGNAVSVTETGLVELSGLSVEFI